MINNQGDIAIIIEEHPDIPGQYFISAYQPLQSDAPTEQDISNSYLSACDIPDSDFDFDQFKYLLVPNPPPSDSSPDSTPVTSSFDTPIYTLRPSETPTNSPKTQASTFATRKYKPVAKKVRAVLAELPEKYRITRNIIGDPLEDMPTLSPNPPDFQPTSRYTAERCDIIDKAHSEEFLWHEE